jgi:hypothetical protein
MSAKLLDTRRIHGLYQATIEAGLAGQRMALLQGIDARCVAQLPSSDPPSAQLLTDLHELNRVLADGSVPIVLWLENAFLLAGPRAAAAVFEASLVALGRAAPAPSRPDSKCPFPGLSFFDESMAGSFFGRRAEIDEATTRLGDTAQGHRRWLQIEGPSGVGKSSLARAGLVPAIRKGQIEGAPRSWRVALLRPGTNPVRALAREVRRALADLEPPSVEALLKQLQGSSAALGEILRAWVPEGEGFLLVVDQLEEAFALTDRGSRAVLDALLARALGEGNGSFYLLTTIRSDFVGRFGELPGLESLLNNHEEVDRYVLRAMTGPGLRESVEEPAKRAGIAWEKGLATRVLKDASVSEGGLPLLAYVLRALWLNRDGQTLTHRSYEDLGRVGGALAKSADTIVDELGKEGKEQARRLLLRLVKLGRGADDTRQMASRAEVLAAAGGRGAESVLTRLSGGVDSNGAGHARARLVTVGAGEDAGEQRVELIHEALLKEWQTLRQWLHDGRKDLELRDDVEAAALLWTAQRELESGLPSGGQLAYLRDARGLSARGQRFLEAAEKLERRKISRKRARFWGLIVAGASFLVILIPNALSSAREQEDTKRKLIRQTNRTNATMAAGWVLSYLRSLGDAVRRSAEDPRLVRALEGGKQDEIDAVCRGLDELNEDPSQGLKSDDRAPVYLWFVLDRDAVARGYATRSVAADEPFKSLIGASYLFRDYFEGAKALADKKQHQPYVSSAFPSTINDLFQFAISAPIYGSDREWKGVLVAAVTTKSKLGSLGIDDGQNLAVLAAPRDPSGWTPWIAPTSRPDPPEYVILSHPLFADGEHRPLDNDLVRSLGRDSQEKEKHIERWWELSGARRVVSSDDYEDPLGRGYRDARSGAEIAADPRYSGRRQASFAPVGHTGFVVIVRASETDAMRGEWELIRRLVRWAALAAVPGLLLVFLQLLVDSSRQISYSPRR